MALPIVAAALPAVGSMVGTALQGYGNLRSARAAQAETRRGMEENRALSEAERERQMGLQQPWIAGGQQAFDELGSFRMREAGPYQHGQFGGVNMNEDPGVQFRMQQAQKGLDTSAGAKGMLMSGPQARATMEMQQDLASQEFGNAYARQYGQFSDEENARRDQANIEAMRMKGYDDATIARLQGLSGQGQVATGQASSALGQIGGQQIGNQMTLRGAMADTSATRAGLPWATAGGMVQSAGNLGGDLASYYMRSKK